MDMISYPVAWRRKWGEGGALFLMYLTKQEEIDDEWFPISMTEPAVRYGVSPSGLATSRERLRADGVIDIRKSGTSYMARIDHDVLGQVTS